MQGYSTRGIIDESLKNWGLSIDIRNMIIKLSVCDCGEARHTARTRFCITCRKMGTLIRRFILDYNHILFNCEICNHPRKNIIYPSNKNHSGYENYYRSTIIKLIAPMLDPVTKKYIKVIICEECLKICNRKRIIMIFEEKINNTNVGLSLTHSLKFRDCEYDCVEIYAFGIQQNEIYFEYRSIKPPFRAGHILNISSDTLECFREEIKKSPWNESIKVTN
jgi:hypothetical protein